MKIFDILFFLVLVFHGSAFAMKREREHQPLADISNKTPRRNLNIVKFDNSSQRAFPNARSTVNDENFLTLEPENLFDDDPFFVDTINLNYVFDLTVSFGHSFGKCSLLNPDDTEIYFCASLQAFVIKDQYGFKAIGLQSKDSDIVQYKYPTQVKDIFGTVLPLGEGGYYPYRSSEFNSIGRRIEDAILVARFIDSSGLLGVDLEEGPRFVLNKAKDFISSAKFASPLQLNTNHTNIFCHSNVDDPNMRYLMCKSDDANIVGILDLMPPDYGTPYSFLYGEKFIPGIEVSKISDAKGQLSFGEVSPWRFNAKYEDLDEDGVLEDIPNIKNAEVKQRLQRFCELLKEHKQNLKSYEYVQNFYTDIDGSWKSYLQIPDYGLKKNKYNNVVVNIPEDFRKYNEEIILPKHSVIVNEDRAQEIFDYMYQDLKSVVAFGHPENGLCYTRAHLVAHWLAARGYSTGKLWVAGNIKIPNRSGEYFKYHVAAFLEVRGADGIKIKIFEPAPDCNRPLSKREWFIKHGISTPKMVQFPLPQQSALYEDFIVAETSHMPAGPYAYFSQYPYERTLIDMRWLNENFLKQCAQNQ